MENAPSTLWVPQGSLMGCGGFVRYSKISTLVKRVLMSALCQSGHYAAQQNSGYSITSSARASSVVGLR